MPLGNLRIISTKTSLLAMYFRDRQILRCSSEIKMSDDVGIIIDTKSWLARYFAKTSPSITLPLSPNGTPFQKMIWEYLCEIPYGGVMTYGTIAKMAALTMGKEKMSAQAIGNAISRNPISIIIPCHRVIGSNNALVGYAAGVDIKRRLLALEGFSP